MMSTCIVNYTNYVLYPILTLTIKPLESTIHILSMASDLDKPSSSRAITINLAMPIAACK